MELDEIFVCFDCDKIFRSDNEFKQHVPDCNETGLSLPRGEKRGRKPMPPKEIGVNNTCELCGISYSNPGSLSSHMHRVHVDSSVTCSDCGQILKNISKFCDHRLKMHGEKKPCPECGIVFNEYNLRRHKRRVHSNKEFHVLVRTVENIYITSTDVLIPADKGY